MAEIQTFGKFDVNFTTKIMELQIAYTAVTLQEIYDTAMEANARINHMDEQRIASASGQDDLGGGLETGLTVRMLNGWRVQAADRAGPTQVSVSIDGGNLVTTEANGPDPTNPLAPATFVTYNFSKAVSAVVVGLEEVIFIDSFSGLDSQPGTSAQPVATASRAKVLADAAGIRTYRVRGTITLDANHDNWNIQGDSAVSANVLNLAGFSINNSHVLGMSIEGTATESEVEMDNCVVGAVSGISGTFIECGLIGPAFTVTGSAASYLFDRCYSKNIGATRPIFDVNSTSNNTFQFRSYSGTMTLRNMAGGNFTCSMLGSFDADSTNTGGTIVLTGSGIIDDIAVGVGVTVSNGFAWAKAGYVSSTVDQISGNTLAAQNLSISTQLMLQGTVDDAAFTPTATEFESSVTTANADIFIGRAVIFGPTGSGTYQPSAITDYVLTGGKGHFTVSPALPVIPANGDPFLIV